MKMAGLFFILFYFATVQATCPPKGFDSVTSFDIEKYINKSWYIQEQMPVSYQPEDSLYCVVATYEPQDPADITKGIRVLNYANNDEVNGEQRGTSGSGGDSSFFGELQAEIPDIHDPSKLLVGPRFLERLFGRFSRKLYGDYWIVAIGPTDEPDEDYQWAIVSGGPPRRETENGCQTGWKFLSDYQTNGIGLWLFSRTPVDPANTAAMRKIAKDLGFDLSVLKPVEHKGCSYAGAVRK